MAPVTRSQKRNENSIYNFDHPRRQNISLPYNYSGYIFKNYTPKAYKNLVKTCKQFFGRERLIVVEALRIFNHKIKMDDVYLALSVKALNANKIKLWITESLYYNNFQNIINDVSFFLKIIYQFNGTMIEIYGQRLTIDDYMMLVASKKLEDIDLRKCKVENNDGSLVSVETLFRPLTNIEDLRLLVFSTIYKIPKVFIPTN